MIVLLILKIAFCAQVYGGFAEDYVTAHNKYRRMILNGENPRQPQAVSMPDMVWDDDLAAGAQDYANQCKFSFSSAKDRKLEKYPYVGETIVGSTSTNANFIVKSFYDLNSRYNFTTNSCNGFCRSYLQLVWADSVNLGCATNQCTGIKVIVCRYGPGGALAAKRPYEPVGGIVVTEDPTIVNMPTEMVEAHNALRRLYLNGGEKRQPQADSMPDMVWDDEIAANAQRHADKCIFEHSTPQYRQLSRFKVGENIYSWQGFPTNEVVVKAWYSEISRYTFETNGCTSVCGHYTQVIWADSIYLGCGRTYCIDPEDPQYGSHLVVCQYGPAGNHEGARPYIEKMTPIQREMIEAHNSYRRGILNGTEKRVPLPAIMPNLSWDKELAKKAQTYADKCVNEHSTDEERADSRYTSVGENIYFSPTNLTNQEVADAWYNQIAYYTYKTNACSGNCDDFKQMIWATTLKFGCGRAYCPTDESNGNHLIVCQYGPGGNEADKKPYDEKYPNKFTVPPTNIITTSRLGDRVSLSWTNSVPVANVFSVRMDETVIVTNLKSTKYTVTGLTPCSDYKIVIIAVDKFRNTIESEPVTISTASSNPVPVQSVTLQADSDSQITATIVDVERLPCANISYNIYLNRVKYTSNSTSYQITGLKPATSYTVDVKAIDNTLKIESAAVKSNSVRTPNKA